MHVADVQGPEDYCTGLIQAASRFEFYDPLAVRLSDDYLYSGVQFVGPRDMTIVFRCNPLVMSGWDPDGARLAGTSTYEADIRDYLRGEGLYTVVFVMMAVLAAAAILIPFINPLPSGEAPCAACPLSRSAPLAFYGLPCWRREACWLWTLR